MKKISFLLAFVAVLLGLSQNAAAQSKGEYRQSQSRMIEPQQQVFVRPLVVDLHVTTNERQKAVWPFPEVDIYKMTVQDVENLKINALYLTAQKMDADVIVAPTFDIRTVKKGIEITVIGFPAKYENWKVAEKEEDYKWIEAVYGTRFKYNIVNPAQSLGGNQAKNSDAVK